MFKRYRPELMLAAVLLALVLAVCQWQAPGTRLSAAEVEAYLAQIERLAPMPDDDKAELLRRMRAWGMADDGRPVYMLNLMRYHDRLRPWPGQRIEAASPEAANRHYEDVAVRIALPKGLSMAFAGATQGLGDLPETDNLIGGGPAVDRLDRILVVRYPNRRAFFELISAPEYLKVMPYKFAAMSLVLTPMSGLTVTPDLRLLAGLVAVILLFGFGWWRAAGQPQAPSQRS